MFIIGSRVVKGSQGLSGAFRSPQRTLRVSHGLSGSLRISQRLSEDSQRTLRVLKDTNKFLEIPRVSRLVQ